MEYGALVLAIKKYLKQLYNYRIGFDLRIGKPLVAERAQLCSSALPGINREILELLLQQMSEDGYIISDDGQTAEFSVAFVFD